jgi:hypothetical protein
MVGRSKKGPGGPLQYVLMVGDQRDQEHILRKRKRNMES